MYSVLDRFWSNVDVRGADECWRWTACAVGNGWGDPYGRFNMKLPDGRWVPMQAHRLAWILGNARPIASGLHIDHICRFRLCCNPRHLEPVTPIENRIRGLKGDLATACKRGHPLTAENLDGYKLRKFGQRECKACRRDRRAGRI